MKIYLPFAPLVLMLVFVSFLSPIYGQWDINVIDNNISNATLISVADLDDDFLV